MEKKFKYRDKCPICESTKFKFFCNLSNEYLYSSKSGWCTEEEILINAQKIKKAEKVKTLHPGHVQVWNYNGLSLSEYVKGKNYRIIPLRINDKFIDLSSGKNLIFKIKSQLINIIKYSYDYLSIKNNNFKHSFFLAVKK